MLLMNLECNGRRLLLTEYTPCSTWQAVYSRPQGISTRKSYTEKAYIFKTFPAARAFSVGNPVRKRHTSSIFFPLRGPLGTSRKSYTEKAYIFKTFSRCADLFGRKYYTEKAYIFKTFPAARAFQIRNKKSYTEKYIFKKFPAARALQVGND